MRAEWAVGTVLAVATAVFLLAPDWATESGLVAVNVLVVLAFLLAGATFARDRARRGVARLCAGVAVGWVVGVAGSRPVGPLPLLEFVGSPLAFALLAALLLGYPSARPPSRAGRRLVWAVVVWCTAGRLVSATVSTAAAEGYHGTGVWWPTIDPDPELRAVLNDVVDAGCAVLAAAFVVLVVRRLLTAHGLDRRILAPVGVASVGAAVAAIADVVSRVVPDDGPAVAVVLAVEAVAVLSVPAAFLATAVRRRLGRSVVADLVRTLATASTPERIQDALRQALDDPGLTLWFFLPERATHVDVAGHESEPVPVAPGRVARPVRQGSDRLLGHVVLDERVVAHTELIGDVVSAAALAIDNGRLQAEAMTRLQEVLASRARIVEAELAERKRIERDLHDGVQQQLATLKVRLAAAALQNPVPAGFLDEVREGLQGSIDELRAIARGVNPPRLGASGLRVALTGLSARAPLPVAVDIPDRRWAPTIEATAFYVASEAMTNVLKHAGATRADIRVIGEVDHVVLTVSDDGQGGARIEPGGGLEGIRDRLHAVGGTLDLHSDDGGTRLTARLPCA